MRSKLLLGLLMLSVIVVLGGCSTHPMNHEGMKGHQMDNGGKMDHSAHQAMMQRKDYDRKIQSYQVPDLLLTNNHGQHVSLARLLDTDKPVILNFIYATCTTICPMLSMGYIDLQRELGDQPDKVMMISITIDPEHDTPEVLEAYRQKFHGNSGWTLLTGNRSDIDNVMTSFDAYFGDKMDHQPLNFIRLPDKSKWVRLNGMINGKDFIHEMKMAGVY